MARVKPLASMSVSSLPEGYRAAPLDGATGIGCWPICLLVCQGAPDPPGPVLLWNLPDVRAYLGCVLDGQGLVREWVQIWVQNLQDTAALTSGSDEPLSNEQLDRHWQRHWRASRELDPGAVVLEWPQDQQRPLYFDPRAGRIVCPSPPGGGAWRLCREDQLLAAAGLPPYSRSLYRYLQAHPPSARAPAFVAVSAGAPLGETAATPSAELGFDPAWQPVNPQAGPLVVRTHPPLDYVDYVDLLNGANVAEVAARKSKCEAAILVSRLTAGGHDGRRHGLLLSGGRPEELFYLKLRLWLQAVRAVQAHLRQLQCPLLNLDPYSFGVFVAGGGDLPWPWTTTCQLVRPGRALRFEIPYTSLVRFVPVGDSGLRAYCPVVGTAESPLAATVRVRQVELTEDNRVSFEGLLHFGSEVHVDKTDLLRLRLSEEQVGVDFYGMVIGPASGWLHQVQFRTWPRPLSASGMARLRRAEGGQFERCWCKLIPVLSSPYDMHSLAVLGARTLLVHEDNPLPEVVEALDRLGRAFSSPLSGQAAWAEVVATIERELGSEASFGPLQGRHLLGKLQCGPEHAQAIPSRLWAEALALLLRLRPGLGPISQCADYGCAPADRLHLPLEEPLEALETLTVRARSLVVSDWTANWEIRQVLAELQRRL